MTTIWADHALTARGWERSVTVRIGADGRIAEVYTGADGAGAQRVGCLLPAPANAHSHAFQRAMAGLTEQRGPDPRDSFWTWRQLMFRFLDRLSPEQVEAIAAFVQMEMLEAGYAAVAEFHYLHHQTGGVPYEARAELSLRIAAAADTSGIGLTLLPVLYRFGGCDGRPLGPGQIRFGNDPDGFALLAEGAARRIAAGPGDWRIGLAPHSLRAVARDDMARCADLAETLAPGAPLHMHLAEQVAEVEEVQATWGARPVEWVLDHTQADARWHFIHCTQMTPEETAALARSGAAAVLCPITESSLGDGIFDLTGWDAAGGVLAVGSDSNIRIALSEELRTLEYSQRLRDRARAVMARPGASTGRRLYDGVCAGGARAAARGRGAIAPGEWADLTALNLSHPDLEGVTGDTILDSWIFAGDDRMVRDVWSAGRHVVRDGRHVRRDAITAAWRRAVAGLREGL